MSNFEVPYIFTPALNSEVRAGQGRNFDLLVRYLQARNPGVSVGNIKSYLGWWAWPPVPPETAAEWWPEQAWKVPAMLESAGTVVPILLADPLEAMSHVKIRSLTRTEIAKRFGEPGRFRKSAIDYLSRSIAQPTKQQIDSEVERFIRFVTAEGEGAGLKEEQPPKSPPNAALSLEAMSRRSELVEHWISLLDWLDRTMQRAEKSREHGAFLAFSEAWGMLQTAMLCPDGATRERQDYLKMSMATAPLARIRTCWFLAWALRTVFTESSDGTEAIGGMDDANIMRLARDAKLPADVLDDVSAILRRRPRAADLIQNAGSTLPRPRAMSSAEGQFADDTNSRAPAEPPQGLTAAPERRVIRVVFLLSSWAFWVSTTCATAMMPIDLPGWRGIALRALHFLFFALVARVAWQLSRRRQAVVAVTVIGAALAVRAAWLS